MRSIFPPVVILFGAVSMSACEGTGPTAPIPVEVSHSLGVVDLGAEIRTLIATGFPKGHATAINAMWDQTLRALAKDPRTTLKGKTVPGAGGRTELARTVAFIDKKTTDVTPPAGENQAHFVARLVLDMSLYVYNGPAAQPPPLAATSDVAFALVQPTSTDTVVTTAKAAAVIFPAGAVAEPTVVVITPITTGYPDNCTGPLVTHLCQYPLFYTFNVFPDVKLAVSATVQVCHVDAGTNRLPLADHNRFRVAHDKPANAADYSPGGTIVDGVEVLALVVMNVTTCTAGGGTTYSPIAMAPDRGSYGPLTGSVYRVLSRLAAGVRRVLVPRAAYAIDVGGGGLVDEFSTFGVVDPKGIADLAQSTSVPTRFSLPSITQHAGDALDVASWTIGNEGSNTSGAFTSAVIVANDTLLTEPVATINVGGAAFLIARASFGYPAMGVPLPGTLPHGTYFVGTAITPASDDDHVTNNRVSVRVTVTASRQADIAQSTVSPTQFSLVTPNAYPGDILHVKSWEVSNKGSRTSGAFTSAVVLASDSLLTTPLSTLSVGGGSGLAAGASYAYGSVDVPLPLSLMPGRYYLGTRLTPAGPDSSVTDDLVSVRVTVNGLPDIAQSVLPATRFSLSGLTVQPGQLVTVNPWAVTNQGRAQSGAFTSVVRLATDSLMTKVIATTPVGGPASLLLGANYSYPSLGVTIPAVTPAGSYFVGTVADPTNAVGDTSLANNLVSVGISVMGRITLAPKGATLVAGWANGLNVLRSGAATDALNITVISRNSMQVSEPGTASNVYGGQSGVFTMPAGSSTKSFTISAGVTPATDTLIVSGVNLVPDTAVFTMVKGTIQLSGWPAKLAPGDSALVQFAVADPNGAAGNVAFAETFALAGSGLVFTNGHTSITSIDVPFQHTDPFYVKATTGGTATATITSPDYVTYTNSISVPTPPGIDPYPQGGSQNYVVATSGSTVVHDVPINNLGGGTLSGMSITVPYECYNGGTSPFITATFTEGVVPAIMHLRVSVPATLGAGLYDYCFAINATGAKERPYGVRVEVRAPVSLTPVARVTVTPTAPSEFLIGETLQLTATTVDAAGNVLSGRAVSWVSSTAAFTVSSSGLVTAVAAGSATITATSEGQSGSTALVVSPSCVTVCAVRLTGRVTYSDGQVAAGATVILSNVTPQPNAVTDASGNYAFLVAPGRYAVDVAFKSGVVTSTGRSVAATFLLDRSMQRDFVVPIITLEGRVVDDAGTAVPDVRLHALAFAQNNCCGGFDVVDATSGPDGSVSVRIPPNGYIRISLTPPTGSSYITTPLPNATWSVNTTQNFVIARVRTLSGVVRFADGAPAAGVSVIASAGVNAQTTATTDTQGAYTMSLAAATYSVDVAFFGGGFATPGRTTVAHLAFDQSLDRDLTIPTILLSGRVVDQLGTTVPNVVVYAQAFAQNACCGGFDVLKVASDAAGKFSLRILPNTYARMTLTPPTGSTYISTPLPNTTWAANVTQDFVIQQSKIVSGVVRYGDGSLAAGVTVSAVSATNVQTSVTTDMQGSYRIALAPATYTMEVAFSGGGFSTQGRTVASAFALAQDLSMDLAVPTVTWSGMVVDGTGAPVRGTTVSALAFAKNVAAGGFDNLSVLTGADGRFSVQVLSNNYIQVHLVAPSASNYVDTPLPDQNVAATINQTYVIVTRP